MEAILTPSVEADGKTPLAPSNRRLWAGRTLSGLAVAFLLFDSVMKLVKVAPVVEATQRIGYPDGTTRPLGLVLFVCVVFYLAPRTAVLGAVLLTAYLGGAVATHVRVEDPLFSHVLFPVYFAFLVWGGLYLRDARVRAMAPWAK
jgi:hypothetical protein